MRTITRKGLPPPEEQQALRLLRERNGYVLVVDALEKSIVNDIFARTNWFAEQLGGYETTDEEVARDVLPILREWFPRVAHLKNFRGAIYHRFLTPHASPYVETLIEWYLREEEYVNHTCLVQALAAAARPEHAERLWQLCQGRPPRDFRIFFMVRLCRFRAVEREIKDVLVSLLYGDPTPRFGDLREISTVPDPRIRQWFKDKLSAPDATLRSIARRCLERGAKLPSGLIYAPVLPDRLVEIRSWEIDRAETGASLMKVGREFNLKIPSVIRKGRFLDTADLDRWLVTHLSGKDSKESVLLWFRLEDFDTVEVLLNRQQIPGTTN